LYLPVGTTLVLKKYLVKHGVKKISCPAWVRLTANFKQKAFASHSLRLTASALRRAANRRPLLPAPPETICTLFSIIHAWNFPAAPPPRSGLE
jgi:hypothetical protein